MLEKLDANEEKRYRSRLRWFEKKLEESLSVAQIRVVNVEGHTYDPGMAATPLNIDEFESQDVLVVDQMLEPILMGPTRVIKTGTVHATEDTIMKTYVGIDLGTTNSSISSFDGDNVRIWKSPEQNDVTPSVIYIGRRGNKYVGQRAYDSAPHSPDNAASLFKRMMGTSHSSSLLGCWPNKNARGMLC